MIKPISSANSFLRDCFAIAAVLFLVTGCLAETQPLPVNGNTSSFIDKSDESLVLIVGTATGKGAEGVYRLTYDRQAGDFSVPLLITPINNPIYGALSKNHTRLYLTGSGAGGEGLISGFNLAPRSDRPTPINSRLSLGDDPCYVSLSADERYLVTANYGSGNLAVFKLDVAGALLDEPTLLQHQGQGKDKQRQQGPHTHWAQWSPESNFIYAVDLGIDQVLAYPFDSQSGRVGEVFTALKMDPGAGPRHMVFHPQQPWVYVVNELSNDIVFARRKPDGQLTPRQTISTLPAGYTGRNLSAHIAISRDGSRLYSSNRGHDSIAVFAISPEGSLSLLQHVDTQGSWPRFFLLLESEQLLLVANQFDDSIVAFDIDEYGLLKFTGSSVTVSQPVYIANSRLN